MARTGDRIMQLWFGDHELAGYQCRMVEEFVGDRSDRAMNLLVVQTAYEKSQWQRKQCSNWKVVKYGENIRGYEFDRVVDLTRKTEMGRTEYRRYVEWWNTQVEIARLRGRP